jgi:hypothetical protein
LIMEIHSESGSARMKPTLLSISAK